MKIYMTLGLCFIKYVVFSQSITAYIYRDSIRMKVTTYQKNLVKADSLKKVYITEIDKTQKEIDAKFKKITEKYTIAEGETLEGLKKKMSETDLQNLKVLEAENDVEQTKVKNYNATLNEFYSTKIKPVEEIIDSKIKAYSLKNKIDYVMIMDDKIGSYAYINKARNITKDIINSVLQAVK